MKKPVVLAVLDGFGCGDGGPGDAVALAATPNLDHFLARYPHVKLKAHGTAVGLPSDENTGNSEVGHNALGTGQICWQRASLVERAMESGEIFRTEGWRLLVRNCLEHGRPLHLLGLLSDANDHSHIRHLKALLRQARQENLPRVCCHVILDGFDTTYPASEFAAQIEVVLAELRDEAHDYRIVSGGGCLAITMDRYGADWAMVERGWNAHVHGVGRQFPDALTAIRTLGQEGYADADIPAFVVADANGPIGTIKNGDSVLLFNFRGDRAEEIARAFDEPAFDKFDRGGVTDVCFVGIMPYDDNTGLPRHYLVEKPQFRNTMTELFCRAGLREYALSETQKYGHVTYFWNGNRTGMVDETLECYEEIPSDLGPAEAKPAMKSVEITDRMVEVMAEGRFDFLRCNYPNGDMVGHSGNLEAAIAAVEAVDQALGRLMEAAERYGYVLCIAADHGNVEKMLDHGQPHVGHSCNPIRFLLCDPDRNHVLGEGPYGLANVAGTIAQLLEIQPPDCWEPGMLQ